jgi:6-phosphofructokinase
MRIGILTGGGDCPALNAVIRAAVKTSAGFGWEVLGIEEGFDGLVHCKTRPMNLPKALFRLAAHSRMPKPNTQDGSNASVESADAWRQGFPN